MTAGMVLLGVDMGGMVTARGEEDFWCLGERGVTVEGIGVR